MRLIKEKVHT